MGTTSPAWRKFPSLILVFTLMTFIGQGVGQKDFKRCGSLITYRQYSTLLAEAPQCFRNGCATNGESATSLSSACPLTAPCYPLWTALQDQFNRDWCASCHDDLACRIGGWPILNMTQACDTSPGEWIYHSDNEACCVDVDEPFLVADWIQTMCNGSEWRTPFDKSGGMAELDWEDWKQAWNWTVRVHNSSASSDPPPSCSSSGSSILTSWAIENATTFFTAFVGTFLARSISMKGNQFRIPIGPEREDKHWLFSIIGGFGEAISTVISKLWTAYVITHTEGYRHTGIPYLQLFLLFNSRPSVGGFLCAFGLFLRFFRRPTEDRTVRQFLANTVASFAVGELLLQLLGFKYLIMTVVVGNKKKFFYANHLSPYIGGKAALRMYAGALLWTIFMPFTLIGLLSLSYLYVYKVWHEGRIRDPKKVSWLPRQYLNVASKAYAEETRYLDEQAAWYAAAQANAARRAQASRDGFAETARAQADTATRRMNIARAHGVAATEDLEAAQSSTDGSAQGVFSAESDANVEERAAVEAQARADAAIEAAVSQESIDEATVAAARARAHADETIQVLMRAREILDAARQALLIAHANAVAAADSTRQAEEEAENATRVAGTATRRANLAAETTAIVTAHANAATQLISAEQDFSLAQVEERKAASNASNAKRIARWMPFVQGSEARAQGAIEAAGLARRRGEEALLVATTARASSGATGPAVDAHLAREGIERLPPLIETDFAHTSTVRPQRMSSKMITSTPIRFLFAWPYLVFVSRSTWDIPDSELPTDALRDRWRFRALHRVMLRRFTGRGRELLEDLFEGIRIAVTTIVAVLWVIVYIAQWLFWSGFVDSSGPKYVLFAFILVLFKGFFAVYARNSNGSLI